MIKLKRTWSYELLIDVYLLAKRGESDTQIWQWLGTTDTRWRRWKKDYPELNAVLQRARTATKEGGDRESFIEYCHRHLPKELHPIWQKVMFWSENETASIDQIEKIFHGQSTRTRQQIFIHALVHFNFSYNKALAAVGTTKRTLDLWIQNDPDFPELLQQIQWYKKNFFEDMMVELVNMGHPAAVIHVNKTINKDRGYGNQVDVNHKGDVTMNVNVNFISVDKLSLDIETKKRIREAVRTAQLTLPVPVATPSAPYIPHTPAEAIDAELVDDDNEGD